MSWRHGQAAGLLDFPRPPAKAVLLALAHHANEHTGQCWPDVERLMQFTALSRRAVQGALRELEAAGIIETRIGGRGRASLYTLRLPGVEPVQQQAKGAPPAGYGAPPAPKGAPPAPQQSRTTKGTDAREERTGLAPLPDDWWPDAAAIAWARANFTTIDVDAETRLFIDASARKGEMYANPVAAWRVWIRRGEGYAQRDQRLEQSRTRRGARDGGGADRLRQAAAAERARPGLRD